MIADEFTDELRAELTPDDREKLNDYPAYGHVWPYLLEIAKTRLALRQQRNCPVCGTGMVEICILAGCADYCTCRACQQHWRVEAERVLPVRGEEDEQES